MTTEPALLILDPDGPLLRDARDLVGEAWGRDVDGIVVPVSRLDPAFFDLRSGVAGEFTQKLTTYRYRLAIVGDVAGHVAASDALRDYVRECNRGRGVRFAADLDAAKAWFGSLTS